MAHAAPAKKKTWFRKQPMMRKVEIALIPALIGSVYYFGWRSLAMVVWVSLVGMLAEFIMAKRRGDPVTEAVFVTSMLFGLSLPPTLPFWQAAVGIVVGILFGKEVFGGFARNPFNPAIVGRGFIYVCFPVDMTSGFTPVWKGFPGGFAHWAVQTFYEGIDAMTAATPMWSRRDYAYEAGLLNLFLGNIGDVFTSSDGVTRALAAGSMGEVSALLVFIGGIYLLWTKTANWRLTVSTLGGAVTATVIFRYFLGAEKVPPVLWTLCSGAMLYAAFFMVTDPISAPKNKNAQLIYGAFIGFMIVFFRWKAVFAGGVAFAILLGNTIGPTVEMVCKARADKNRKKAAAAKAEVRA
ncbi:RnfABCDGE type electron transport complex subunit D [Verrucomicrobiota bacterium]